MPDATVAPLLTEAQLARRVEELARSIASTLPPRFTLVGLLNGSFVFVADLARALHRAGCVPRIAFMRVSSYGSGTTARHRQPDGRRAGGRERRAGPAGRRHPGQRPHAGLHPRVPAAARCHPGLDLHPARQAVAARGRLGEVDFVGFAIPDVFVVGYGIDYAERYRELPFIGEVQGV